MKKLSPALLGVLGITVILAGCSADTVTTPISTTPVTVLTQTETQTQTQATQTEQTTQTQQSFQVTPVETNEVSFTKTTALTSESVLSQAKITKLVAAYNDNLKITDPKQKIDWGTAYPGGMGGDSSLKGSFRFYNEGKLKVAPYKDWNLLVLALGCDGPCDNNPVYRLAQNPANQDLVMLTKYSDDLSDNRIVGLLAVATQDKKFTISALDLPATLAITDSKAVLKLKFADSEYIPDSITYQTGYKDFYTKVLYNSTIGPVYAYDTNLNSNGSGIGCVQVKKPDGSVATYTFEPGFDNNKLTMKPVGGTEMPVAGNYEPGQRGCGIGANCYFTTSVNEKNLQEYATLSNGLKLYAPIKTDEKADSINVTDDVGLMTSTYKQYASSYQYGDTSKPKLTFAQYVTNHPVLFWQDPFKRWSTLVSSKFAPAAECGKPVIYFYPQKDTKVSVKVGIDKITKSDPNYGTNGWTVLAHVGGLLTNYADGKNYPYLFWEGQSSKMIKVENGFSVARGDLATFLNRTLKQAGLNAQESKDFTDFWYPRMMANKQPYFIISFVGTSQFNKIAPLNISPKPDTLARVFMYYQPSYANVNLRPQVINGFARRGFTVVEWGGTSNIPWVY